MAKRRNKNRSLDAELSGIAAELQDDPNQIAVHSAYLGTVAVDVRKVDVDTYKNRETDLEHVAALIESFKRGIRRFFKEVRIRATMTQTDYDRLLSHYVEEKAPNIEYGVPQARIQASNTDGGKLEDFIYLKDWPETLALPSLIAGQHRRTALITILDEQKKVAEEGGKRPDGEPLALPSSEAYYWAIEIYETDRVQGNALATLR